MERTGEELNWVRVVTYQGDADLGTFLFYPFDKDKENAWILGCGGNVRIPMSAEEWMDMGPGRHVRVAFDDGMHYLGVIAYQTVSKDWHVFFEDGEEFDLKVPVSCVCVCVCMCVCARARAFVCVCACLSPCLQTCLSFCLHVFLVSHEP